MDPALVAVAGALSTVAAVLFRIEEKRIKDAETEALFWRDKYLGQLGMTDLALDEAERRKP